ncbi:hypothetical protein [Lishizhenia sp.]|uniref:hypothetical protein n=1 Tax=Lishizhenia sp. TaxID=2497594 RepID=UPI00299E0D5E|nr:hypothetical protein [Lishizhenia sp.]MDX1445849.1 hypothetical protein [Lishizhenia sp.]
MPKTFFLLLLSLILVFQVQAQSNLLKAVELKNQAQTEYNNGNYRSAQTKINNAISLIKKEGMDIPGEMISLRSKINAAIDQEAKDKAAAAARKKELADKKQQQLERAALQKEAAAKLAKEKEMERYEPAIRSTLAKLGKLKEGRVYIIERAKLTTSSSEKSYFVYYGNKYMIFTIPSEYVVNKIDKSTISFNSQNAQQFNSYVTNVRVKNSYGKQSLSFRKGIHYSNVFLGGNGDELLWHGTQYTNYDENVHYYYYTTLLHADIEMEQSFEKEYFQPYIQTGTLSRLVDYNFVVKDSLTNELRANSFTQSSLNGTNKVKLSLKSTSFTNMLFVTKEINYQLIDNTVEGSYSGGGYNYTKGFLYYQPKKRTSYYAFVQFPNVPYSTDDVLGKLKKLEEELIIPKSTFDSFYDSFGTYSSSDSQYRYFSNSAYTLPYNVLKAISDLNQSKAYYL